MQEYKGLRLKKKESAIEREFKEYAETKGCETRKFKYKKDDPDQQCLCPGGRTLFVEFKRPKNMPRPGQLRRIQELSNLGYTCAICWTIDGAKDALDRFLANDET